MRTIVNFCLSWCSNIMILLLVWTHTMSAQKVMGAMKEKFSVRIVADSLSDPWEIAYGPDNYLWVTESRNYLVSRINPADGKKDVVLDLNAKRLFPRYDKIGKEQGGKPWPQGGLMGMALHPELLNGKPYVYLMYIYRFEGVDSAGKGCKDNFGGCRFLGRVVRYDYNKQAKQLLNPVTLCDSIPQSNDHNGGRLTLAPVKGKLYLFCTVGDMGAGQFGNAGQPNRAQDINSYEGKILRFNTEPDADTMGYDKWVPNDNPYNSKAQNAVWSLGHRNPQGLACALINGNDLLYSTEHGPFSDDEVNIIDKGANYGHPLISGYADGNYDGLAASVSSNEQLPGRWNTTYPFIKSEKNNAKKIGTAYRDPIASLYPNANTFLTRLYSERLKGDEKQDWPSEAPSSIAVYSSDAIPGWKHSLLIPTLKGNKLIRYTLDSSGAKITGDTLCYFNSHCRYRDIAISPDGKKIYLSVDNNATSSNPAKENPEKLHYPGTIIEFIYEGDKKVPRTER